MSVCLMSQKSLKVFSLFSFFFSLCCSVWVSSFALHSSSLILFLLHLVCDFYLVFSYIFSLFVKDLTVSSILLSFLSIFMTITLNISQVNYLSLFRCFFLSFYLVLLLGAYSYFFIFFFFCSTLCWFLCIRRNSKLSVLNG